MNSARHVIGCRLTRETRVHNALNDVASTVHQSLPAALRVRHLGVVLKTENVAGSVLHRHDGAGVALAHALEPGRQPHRLVAVAHPHLLLVLHLLRVGTTKLCPSPHRHAFQTLVQSHLMRRRATSARPIHSPVIHRSHTSRAPLTHPSCNPHSPSYTPHSPLRCSYVVPVTSPNTSYDVASDVWRYVASPTWPYSAESLTTCTGMRPSSRGLHLSTFQVNVSTFCEIRWVIQ